MHDRPGNRVEFSQQEEQVREEIRSLLFDKGIETKDGRRIPAALIPRRVKQALERFQQQQNISIGLFLFSPDDRRNLATLLRSQPDEGSSVSSDLRFFADSLEYLESMNGCGGRSVVFDDLDALRHALEQAGTNGGVSDLVSEGGSNFDQGRWTQKTVFNPEAASQMKPAAIFFHDLSKLERITETDNAWLEHFGYKPRNGGDFASSLEGVMVFL